MGKKHWKLTIGGGLLLCIGLLAYKIQDKYFEMSKSLDQMAAVYRDLNTYYVDSLDPSLLMQSGIRAMTQGLDPYTVFFPEEKVKQLQFEKTGEYAGIGASFRIIHDSIFISALFPGAPFEKAGFKTGEIILSLNGEDITGMNPGEVHQLLSGSENSQIEVKVKQPWTDKVIQKKVKRKMVQVPAITYKKVLNANIGYIRIKQFTRGSAADFKQAFRSLKKKNPHLSGMIIDLRDNPGGLLQEAVEISNYFLSKGDTIVSVKGRNPQWNKVYTAKRDPMDTLVSLAVLINGQTASAAEILSGAIQDLDRGVIIGSRSFGKGLVQGTRKLPYNGRLKLTVGRYYTPSGRCIQAIDYTHRNVYGVPIHIADSLKNIFKTSEGRTVMDKGGITPDQKVDQQHLDGLISALINQSLIFRFATRYAFLHPRTPEIDSFKVDEHIFSSFETFVKRQSFSYQSRAEQLLEQFKADAVSQGYYDSLKTGYVHLKKQTHQQTHPSLRSHQKEISQLLVKNIMNCYYGYSGKVAAGLPFDEVVKAANEVLNNKRQYSAILR